MTESQDVIQQLRDHLHRQIRTADQIKDELTEAFSAAAEVLLQQQASELVAAADQLHRQTGALEGLLKAMPQADANVQELLRRTRDLDQQTSVASKRLETLVASLEGTLSKTVDQRLGDLRAAISALQSDFAKGIGETRTDLARHAQTLGKDQEARVEKLLTTARGFLEQAEEMVHRVEGSLAAAERTAKEVASQSTGRIEAALAGGHQELHRQLDAVSGRVGSHAAEIAQRQDRIAKEDRERDTNIHREIEAIRQKELVGLRESSQQIWNQCLNLHTKLENHDKFLKERLSQISEILRKGFIQSTTAMGQLQTDAGKRQAEDTTLFRSLAQQIDHRLDAIEKSNQKRIVTLQRWLISEGIFLILILLLQLFYKP